MTWAFVRLNSGFTAVFGDDCYNVLYTRRWLRHPTLIPHPEVLPASFWLLAAGHAVVRDWLLTPVLEGLLISAAVMFVTYLLCREVFPEPPEAALLAAALAGFHPSSLLFGSISTLEFCFSELSVMTATLFIIRFLKDGRQIDALAASVCLGAGTTARYEDWSLALAFLAVLVWDQLRRRPRLGRRFALASAAAVSAFPAFWLWNQYQRFGEPFHFAFKEDLAHHVYGAQQIIPSFLVLRSIGFGSHPVWRLLTTSPVPASVAGFLAPACELIVRFPLESLLALCAVDLLWERRADRILAAYLAVPALLFASMAPLFSFGRLAPFCHFTHFAVAGLFLSPVAALGALRWTKSWPRRQRLAATAALGAAFLCFDLAGFPNAEIRASNFHVGLVRTCCWLRAAERSGFWGKSDRLLIETYPSERKFGGRFWESTMFLLLDPPPAPFDADRPILPSDRVLFDRPYVQTATQDDIILKHPSVLDASPSNLARFLSGNRVLLAAVHSTKALASLKPFMARIASFGAYTVLVERNRQLERPARELVEQVKRRTGGLVLFRP